MWVESIRVGGIHTGGKSSLNPHWNSCVNRAMVVWGHFEVNFVGGIGNVSVGLVGLKKGFHPIQSISTPGSFNRKLYCS